MSPLSVLFEVNPATFQLAAFLDERYTRGELAWGLHVSDRAVMTCLVVHRMGRQVHFVDGAEGGYTAAAEGFKRRFKSLVG